MHDLLITNALILTMNGTCRIIENGFLAIKHDKIVDIGSMTKLSQKAEKVIDGKGKLVMPGLINAHSHGADVLLRGGLSQDRGLYDWLHNVLYPGMQAYTLDDIKIGTTLFIDEAIRSGITTIVENEDFPSIENHRILLNTFKKSGMRAIFGRMFNDLPTPPMLSDYYHLIKSKSPNVKHVEGDLVEDTKNAMNEIEVLMREYNSAESMVQVWPSPFGPEWCTKEGLQASFELARKRETGITMHLSETQMSQRLFGVSATEYLNSINCLDPRLLVAHCIWLNDRDIRLLKENDVKIAHQPSANMYLADGIAPIPKMLASGITIGLGTDDANANDSVSIFNEMRVASLIHKGNTQDPKCITSEQVLEMATVNGAKAIGMENSIGTLEVGKQADLIIINLNLPHLRPIHHIPSVLTYQTRGGTEVETVIVNGKILMYDKKLTWLTESEEEKLLKDAQKSSIQIRDRANLELPENYSVRKTLFT